ncbi:MAG: dienelactone hydrolase family protein [Chloroflexi bacterium]|nr:dienelactone hydrolase family protein [Chloroflexota bacterium]MQC27147.1 dienelactone hydrolase family protein [Chloroflexota bacterium]
MANPNARMIDYPSNAHQTPGYLVLPEGEGPFPAVVAIQEWWGLNDHMKQIGQRLAAAGFVALVPDLYHGEMAEEPNEARKLAMALDRQRAIEEISAAGHFLAARDDVAPKKVGIIGWCMGGGLSLSTAAHNGIIGAAVCFYGRPLEAGDTAKINAPVLGLFGELDGGIPVSLVQDFEKELEKNAIPHHIHVYAGAQHAFFNDTRPQAYNPDAAQDAWQRALDWFSTHLQPSLIL